MTLFAAIVPRYLLFATLTCATFGVFSQCLSAAETRTGKQIYQQMCAKCHGVAGEGVKDKYAKALIGDRSVVDLAKVISETMPEDSPGTCTDEAATRVATYIHDAFYSRIPQERNKVARVELSRLTVRQYRHAVADLLGSFTETGKWDDERGLQAEYHNSRGFRRDKKVLERVDPIVDFHFGEASPLAEKIEPAEFSIRWQGTVLTTDAGEYEFIVKSDNGVRLWVNNMRQPLIDAGVKSGNDTEFRASLQLLGGRPYPLRLEFVKSKEKTASAVLLWKQPHHADEIIPARNLSPNRFPESFVVQTPFPPDDRSIGYERGTSISKEWDEAETYAAVEVAAYVTANLSDISGVRDSSPDRVEKLREFCRQFASRAFRRPLTDEQRAFFVDRHFENANDHKAAVKKVVLLTLKSPRFLYREIGTESGAGDNYDVAARIAFGLWDSLPDKQLMEAAAKGEVHTREQVAQHAARMIDDARTRAKVREFFQQWLNVDRIQDVSKDKELFPEFNEAIASDLRTSLDLFLDATIWSEASDFRQLLLSDDLYLNGRLAPFYGAELAGDAPFQKVDVDPRERAGVLSHPFLMTGFAYHSTSSPIHRGVFVARSLLGRSLRPPPEAVSPLAPDLHPSLTTRERVLLQTKPVACQTCHAMINPLGFSLENYDALGRFRAEEKGRAIDAAGYYNTQAGKQVSFNGVREMATFLAASEEVHAAFVEQLFHYLVKQPIRAYGPDRLTQLRKNFAENNYSIRKLLVELITVSALPTKNPDLEKSAEK